MNRLTQRRGRLVLAALALIVILAGAAFAVRTDDKPEALPSVSAGSVARPGGSLPSGPAVRLEKVAGGLADPVNIASPPDGSGRIFVVERIGRIRIIDRTGALLEQPFLDISGDVTFDFLEQGLIGLAFHPRFKENGSFYAYYTSYEWNGAGLLMRYQVVPDDPNTADPKSAKLLLAVSEPHIWHNGGAVQFGPDGYLYLGLGDGGGIADPFGYGQDRTDLLGSLLRIDVDEVPVDAKDDLPRVIPRNMAGERPYRIPSDNPFVDDPQAQPEIWAYGLRNPFRFSFDRKTGDLYIPDVGENTWEEINVQPAGSRGGENYGWSNNEGSHCFPPNRAACTTVGTLPVAEYSHEEGGCAVVGIGVYRGTESPSLDGIYFTADWCTGKVWGLARETSGTWRFAELLDTDLKITGGGEDAAGELYLTACSCVFGRQYDPLDQPDGSVWRLVAADEPGSTATGSPTPGP